METNEEVGQEVIAKPTLKRALFMIVFVIIGRIAMFIVFLCALFQFFYALIFKNPNEQVLAFSKSLAKYIKEIADYLTFVSDDQAWPFGKWPKD